MSLTGKTITNTYKDLLQMDNSNSGVDSSVRTVKDGEGTKSALSLGDDNVGLRPQNDDTAGLLSVRSLAGTILLIADSTNLVVKSLGHILNTQYIRFGNIQLSAVANTWYPLDLYAYSGAIGDNLGTGSVPATTHTATHTSIQKYWYIHDNITIDAVKVFHMGDDSASTDTLTYSLNAFELDSSGAGSGDLSDGTVHALSSSQTIDNADIDFHDLSIGTADIDAGRIVLMCVRGGSTINNDISVQVSVKYHLR